MPVSNSAYNVSTTASLDVNGMAHGGPTVTAEPSSYELDGSFVAQLVEKCKFEYHVTLAGLSEAQVLERTLVQLLALEWVPPGQAAAALRATADVLGWSIPSDAGVLSAVLLGVKD